MFLGHEDVVHLLLLNGGQVNSMNNQQMRPLHIAAANGNSEW